MKISRVAPFIVLMIVLSLIPIIICGWEAIYYLKDDNFAMLPITALGMALGCYGLGFAVNFDSNSDSDITNDRKANDNELAISLDTDD